MEVKESKKRLVRNDILFIAVFLILALLGIIYLYFFREKGNTVRVTVDGKEYGVYSIYEDIATDIYTGEGSDQINRLVISDGKVYIENATCPDGICVEHRPIFRDGESIVCLPHGVVVSVDSVDESGAPDIVV